MEGRPDGMESAPSAKVNSSSAPRLHVSSHWRVLHKHVLVGLLCAVSTLALPGCTGGARGQQSRGGTRNLPTFVVAPEPDVTIGTEEGPKAYDLSGVTGALRLPTGSIVVANCQSDQLRYFDHDGRFLRSVGRHGKGPGEFEYLRRIFPASGDSVGAYDLFTARITLFGPKGRGLRTISVPYSPPRFLDVLGRLSDGSFVARRIDERPSVPPGTRYRANATLLLLDGTTGELVDSVASLPAVDLLAPPSPRALGVPLRLARRARFAVLPTRVYYNGQDTAGIIELDSTLARVGVIRPIADAAPVTSAVKQAYEKMVSKHESVPRGGVGPVLADVYPPMLPAFGDLVWGRGGRLWVQDPVRPGRYPLAWTAYNGGQAVARAELPPRFFPFQFGRDWVLGVAYDSLNVERVQLRRLVPGKLPARAMPPLSAGAPLVPLCGSWVSR